ncbi:MAG: DegT/DnrJ/EryC1/StrS family aminotransferase [Bacteroidales bacterium]|nr:DegT/DnrJ/EryC1/StrS family aminotransferase [Bacteroidales bacterium]
MSMFKQIEEYLTEAAADDDYARSHWAGNGAVAKLEKKLCLHYGARHALCVDSATNGLMYLLLATGLKRREILTSPLGFGGTVAGALTLDCKIHFADIDETLNVSPESSRKILERNKSIRAVIAVDYAGNPHRMEALHKVCQDYGVWHFVDAAQSLGANYGRSDLAQFNDAMVLSFGAGKLISAGGEGGAIITDNTELYNKLVSICQHSHRQERDLGIGMSHEFALNGRMHPLAAILASASFEKGLAKVSERRSFFLGALQTLAAFKSVSTTFSQTNSTFYSCPFLVNDVGLFKEEFTHSSISSCSYYTLASMPLPLLMEMSGLKRRIKSSACPELCKLKNNLYSLHKIR